MKFVVLLIIGLLTVSLSSADTYTYDAELTSQQQAFQSFINKKPQTGHLMQDIMNRGFINIRPIGFCDERTVCTSNLQCGFDGVCGQPLGDQRRCVCY